MNTQNKIRNIATKIMATLMSAIYLAVSVNVPVLADYNSDQSITGDEVNIDGDAEVRGGTGQNNFYGVYEDGCETDVSIGNNLTVNSDALNTKGIYVTPNSDQKATVNIGNDLTVYSNNANTDGSTTGIEARPAAGATADITVGNSDTNQGNVTVTGTADVRGIRILNNSNTNITVRGDVTSSISGSNGGSARGVYLKSTADYAITNVNIGCAVNADGNAEAMGLEILPSAHNTNKIYVGKGISASAAEATGVSVQATNMSNTTINIGKDSSGDAITVDSNGNNDDAANSSGISAQLNTYEGMNGSTTATINVEGNIVVRSEVAGARGIYADGGLRTDLNIQVKGDVTSNGAGIYTEDMNYAQCSTDIIIDGTVKSTADGIPAVILDDSSINNGQVSITAWKIESNEGTALLGKKDDVQTLTDDNSQNDVANCISYIIRVTQPEINNAPANVLSLANADGTAWNKKKAWDNGEAVDPTMLDVADESDTVYVKLDVPDGYELVGVYADAEKTVALNQDDDGSYYLIVPRGGGIDVNVALTLIQTDPEPQPQPGPNPSPQPNPVNPDIPPAPVPVSDEHATAASDDAAEVSSVATELPVVPVAAAFTAAQVQGMVESAVAASLTNASGAAVTAVDLDLGNDPSLAADAVAALCSGTVAKRCHFTHDGQKFVLFVPVMDTTSTAYLQCLALLDAEPGKQAGPIRLWQIFAPVGVTLSQE